MEQNVYGLDNFDLSYRMAKLSSGIISDFWKENRDQIEMFIRSNSDKPHILKKFYDALENRVVNRALEGLGVKKYKDLMRALISSKLWKLFTTQSHLLRGESSMQKDFTHKTASRLQKWAEKADTQEDRQYLQILAQTMMEEGEGGGEAAVSPAAQIGLSSSDLESGVAPDPAAAMASMQGSPIDLSTGSDPEAEKGEFDITREPASPMWNIELLRVKANTSEEAQQIVEKFVGWAREHGQPRISVGTIKSSRDDDDKK